MGSDFGELPFAIRDELAAGKDPDAARFLTAGRGLAPLQEISPANMRHAAYAVTTVEGARAAVEELVLRKVTLIKTWVDDRGGTITPMAPELYGAIIDEAHKRGMRVAVHATGLADAKNLLRAGIDVFAHMISDVDEELLALFKQHPNTVVLTALGGPRRIVAAPWLNPAACARARNGFCRSRSRGCRIGSRAQTPQAVEQGRQAWDRLARGSATACGGRRQDRHRHRRRRADRRSIRRLDDAYGAREPRERRADAGAGARSRHAHGGRSARARRSRARWPPARARTSWCSMRILSMTSRTRAGSREYSCGAARSIARSCAPDGLTNLVEPLS